MCVCVCVCACMYVNTYIFDTMSCMGVCTRMFEHVFHVRLLGVDGKHDECETVTGCPSLLVLVEKWRLTNMSEVLQGLCRDLH